MKLKKPKKIQFFTQHPYKYKRGQVQQGLEILDKTDYPVASRTGFDEGLVYLVTARPHVPESELLLGKVKIFFRKVRDYVKNRLPKRKK